MGPAMGYGRGMSLAGMVRGGMGGGYGGYNPYQMQMARMAQMQGGYGPPPQQGSYMRPIGPEGMGGAADANAQGMAAHQAAQAQKQQLMAQGMSEEDAHRGAMQTYESQMGPPRGNMQDAAGAMAGAMPQQGAMGSAFGPPQGNMMGAAAMQGAYGAPARGMGYGGGWGGPMSLGALARMGMFRR